MRLLSMHETIDEKIIELRKKLNRPIYLSSCSRMPFSSRDLYTFPGNTNGFINLSTLEMFLSPYRDKTIGRMFKKIPGNYGIVEYTLHEMVENDSLRIVIPIKDSERYEMDEKIFKTVGLHFGENATVYVDKELVAEGFEPYAIQNNYRNGECRIEFSLSERILKPEQSIEHWFLNCFDKYSLFQPPGWYPNEKWVCSFEDFNRFGIVDLPPGKCLCCKGKSNEQLHFCVTPDVASSSYNSGPKYELYAFKLVICKACARKTFSEWLNYLDNFS